VIVTAVTLTDFGAFRGRQTVGLTPRRSRPIILFGGKNGAGKSTLLEAIRLCLYGLGALGSRVSKEDYLAYLERKIHSNPDHLIQANFASVALEFQYADVDAVHTYRVTRSWERRGAHRITEHLDLERDGKPLDELSVEHWQDFVRDLVPQGVSQLFFFDGEKIQQLAEDTSDRSTLAEAIKSLLGLDLVERLQADLSIYVSRLAATGDESDRREVEDLEAEIAATRQVLEEARTLRSEQESRVGRLKTEIGRVEKRLASEGGSFARNRESLIQARAALRAEITLHENMIRQLAAGLLPVALIPVLCRELADQLGKEERSLQAEAADRCIAAWREEILTKLRRSGFWAGAPRVTPKVQKEITDRMAELLRPTSVAEGGERADRVHELSPPIQRQVLGWIEQSISETAPTVRKAGAELERLFRELHGVEEKIRKIPADDVLRPLLEELHRLHDELAGAGKEALLSNEKIHTTELKLGELERRYGQAVEGLAARAAHGSKIRLVPKVQKVLEEYKARRIDEKVMQLQTAVSECFNILMRKKDVVRKIVIDPIDFSVALYDRQERSVPKEQLSAGEKQIYAIAMLWALARTSGRALPVIIDTPLARLDSDHRRLLVREYLPKASHQVVVLSTDTEVDQSYFAQLRSKVAHAYRLEFEPDDHGTRVLPGYFWKGGDEAE
jgi:DNA sulfur modification protein DndD